MYRYIIVDDEPIIRMGLHTKLKAFGDSIQFAGEADNGRKGLELVERSVPQIVFTDMKMPVLDGIDFLKCLTRMYPEIRVIVISGYKDYEYMHAAIDSNVCGYILKPYDNRELKALVKKAVAELNEKAVMKRRVANIEEKLQGIQEQMSMQLLAAYITDGTNATADTFKGLKAPVLKKGNSYMLVTVFAAEPMEEETLRSVIFKQLDIHNAVFLANHLNAQEYMVLFYFDASGTERETRRIGFFARRLLEIVGNYSGFYICISKVEDSISELHAAYIETARIFTLRKLKDKRGIYNCGDPVISGVSKKPACHNDLFLPAKNFDPDKIRGQISRIFVEIDAETCTFADIKKLCAGIADEFSKYLTMMGSRAEIDLTSEFDRKYRFATEPAQIEQDIAQTCMEAGNQVSPAVFSYDNQVGEIKKFIERNYQTKLSLELISSRFYISTSYCSYIFKLKTGENISDYITKIRINEAKRLLSDTQAEIEFISRQIGYKNVKYFFTIFKKSVGCTPLEYRNRKKAATAFPVKR